MHVKFKVINNKVLITNDKNLKIERNFQNNIKEVLIAENNIEKIKKWITSYESNMKQSKRNIKKDSVPDFIRGGCYLTASTLWFLSNRLTTAILIGLVGIFEVGDAYFFQIKGEKKHINFYKKALSFLSQKLSEEECILNELIKNNENTYRMIDDEVTIIEESEKIKKIKNQLDLIHKFEHNKSKFMKAYKKGYLQNFLIHQLILKDEDISFIEELIKNDLDEKTGEKTFKLKK